MSKKNEIDEVAKAKATLATARKNATAKDERVVAAVDGIGRKIHAAFMAASKAAKVDASAMVFVVNAAGAIRRGGGIGGDKSPSLGRQAKVTDWIVGGKAIKSPMASKLIAAVFNVERAKDVYGADSPERFIRKPFFLDKIKGHKVKVVRDGKASDAIAFLAS